MYIKTIVTIATVALVTGCNEDPRKTEQLYSAWMKTHPQVQGLTQQEWQALREEYLLPGQTKEQIDAGDIALGVMAGQAAGNATRGR